MNQPILNGILESDLDLNGYGFVNIGGLLGTFVTSTESTTVDGQVALFNGTGGKIIRKATVTGIAKLSSGVLSAVTAPTGDLVGHDDTQTLYNKTLALTTIANTGLNFVRPNGAGIVQLLVQDGASSIFSYLPSTSGTLITSAEVSAGYVAKTGSLALAGFSSITGRIGNANLPLAAQLKDVNGVLSVDGDHRILKADDGTESLAWDFTGVTSPGFFGNGSGLTNLVGDNTAYNATTWDGNTGVPTKNAIRDKFESLGGVTSVSVITANGISGSVANATTTPAITLSLGAIKPDSITAPNDTAMIVSGGHHVSGPSWTGASITLDPADPTTHLANVTLTPVVGGSVIISSLTSNGLLKTSGGTGTVSVASMGTGIETFLATPTLVNLKSAITDETTVGWNLLTLADPGVVSFIQLNANNTVTMLTAGGMRGALGLGTAATKDTGTTSGTVPLLDAGGRILSGMVPLGLSLYDNSSVLSANFHSRVLYDNAGNAILTWIDPTQLGFFDGTSYITDDGVFTGDGSGLTNLTSAGANVVPKSNGTNLIASSIVDDGTVVSGGYGSAKFSFDSSGSLISAIGDIDMMASGTKLVINNDEDVIGLYGGVFRWNDNSVFFGSGGTVLYFGGVGSSIAGSFSGVGTATTSFTVTIGTTMTNTTYKANVTPTTALSAAVFYISAKTTTTFTVTYLAGLTGTVTFDWAVFP